MNRWADQLPVVRTPKTDHLKPITLVLPYYENPRFLRRQLDHLAALEHGYPAIAGHFALIVVDDGSPDAPAREVMREGDRPTVTRLFQIGVDIPWNWLAARNIGMHYAATDWCVLTDIDHMVPLDTLRNLIWGFHDPKTIYAFSRREHTGQTIAPHSASFFLTRTLFWRIGGYDEALSGHYGSDGDWRKRCARAAPIQVLTDRLTRYEYIEDASTTRYKRKLPADTAAVRHIVSARRPGWRPKTLSFPYAEVAL